MRKGHLPAISTSTPTSGPRRRPGRLVVALVVTALTAALGGAALAKKAAAGKPSFKAGDPEAYYIWVDDAGWHLRATAAKGPHAYHGRLRATGGMRDVKPTRKGLFKRIEVSGDTLAFDFDLATPGVDGFDWQQGDECLTAELKLDLRADATRVHVGLAGQSPEAIPFLACR